MQIGPGRALRYSQHLANLSVRKTLYIVQDDYRSLSVSQLRQRNIQSPPQLIRFARVTERHRNRFRQLVRIADFPPPHQVERRIGHDAEQPRAKRLIGEKTVERPEGVEKSLLNRVLRV